MNLRVYACENRVPIECSALRVEVSKLPNGLNRLRPSHLLVRKPQLLSRSNGSYCIAVKILAKAESKGKSMREVLEVCDNEGIVVL